MAINLILTVVGVIILLVAADQLLNAAVYFSEKLGIPKFVLGLTVLAMGTSIPELVVNLISSIEKHPEVRFNVVGSNITNILFVTSICAIFFPILIKKTVVTRDAPFMIISVVIFILLYYDRIFNGAAINELSRSDGLILLAVFGVYLYYVVFSHKRHYEEPAEQMPPHTHLLKNLLIGIAALVGVIIGGSLAVQNLITFTSDIGLSTKFAGVVIISIGTNLPDLATNILALKRHHPDLAIGNLIGSCVYNLLFILGLSATLSPVTEVKGIRLDLIFLCISTVFILVVIYWGKRHKITRDEGIFGLLIFILYILIQFT